MGVRVMQGMSLSISHLLTRLVEQVLREGIVTDVTEKIRAENNLRNEIALDILKDWSTKSHDGVNYVWAEVPDGWTGSALLAACEAEGVLVAVADKFTLPNTVAPNAVRLTLSTAHDHDQLKEGLRTVDRIMRSPPMDLLT